MSATALAVITAVLVGVCGAAWATLRWGSWKLLVAGAVAVTAAGWLGVWLYSQRPTPARQRCALPTSAGELGSICGFRNPEDLEHVPSLGLVLVSEEGFGGRVLSLRLDDLGAGPRVLWPPRAGPLAKLAEQRERGDADCPPPSDPSALWPHGLSALAPTELGGPVRVALVSHALRDGVLSDAVQLFDLDSDVRAPLRWRGCIHYPGDVTGNDIALLSDGSFVATNFAPRGTPEQIGRAVLRGALGLDTGDVLLWEPARGWSHWPGTRGAIPNGIAVSRDERAFYFSDAGNERVAIVPSRATGGAIVRVRVGGAPNNLTVTASGKVLATVATLSGEIPFLCNVGGRQCRSGWAVWEIDPEDGSAVEILAEEGRRIATATTALEVEDVVLLGSMADDRVGVYRRR